MCKLMSLTGTGKMCACLARRMVPSAICVHSRLQQKTLRPLGENTGQARAGTMFVGQTSRFEEVFSPLSTSYHKPYIISSELAERTVEWVEPRKVGPLSRSRRASPYFSLGVRGNSRCVCNDYRGLQILWPILIFFNARPGQCWPSRVARRTYMPICLAAYIACLAQFRAHLSTPSWSDYMWT
ncbi:hypothetical protein BU25DRAFT_127755 [Macroventuria anomochaeta]|uniref:Uncharacterized protein n=1 Tax=Macroventuria anomochaeta TaxID=301207 RepID=A0ACB6RS36_9PLEO|nr:uncharacterized protein BU25DRAFT_127755 [Macroventuria anomochaeta]KAF2624861.1 hypothetical protein BU25DRAFT_127755 [Macroventuria anomochaeta]